jgi:type IV fimbrial biogenesis protein FimT
VASAQVARSEAIKRNTTITLCRSANGTSCSGSGGWQQGWIVMAGATTLPTTDDVVLHVQQGLPPEFSITGGDVTFPGTVVGTTPTTLTVCRKTPLGKEERVVTISGTGSAYVTIATTGTCS